ncbi:hypothetical protein [Rothia dentocariosa]|uniref:hypothetical protein n=1 Tax=Rothia dentocariosa TaxID=2047 RepID=UPI000C79D811|nr:hypothetical protein [Rothia dentocariosa]PLA18771.1 hypothetical protein CYK04_05120 [Rothia dentocariosa]
MTTGDEKTLTASRQERFLKAVELLNSAHSYTRLGGVHALVALTDEYLADESLSAEEKHTDGQRIVDILCVYIRSPFELAFRYDELSQNKPNPHSAYRENHQEFSLHRAELLAEAKVRQQALQEIHHRLRHFPQGDRRNYVEGSWSGFEYDFSNGVFFHPVDMKDSWYQNSVDFSGCTYYTSAEFSGSTYERNAYFCDSTYYDWVFFNNSTYCGEAQWSGSTYHDSARFSWSVYYGEVSCHDSVYGGSVFFDQSLYYDEALFYSSTYRGETGFDGSLYRGSVFVSDSVFEGAVSLYGSVFCDALNFGTDFFGEPYPSRFVQSAPCFVAERDARATLFGSSSNNFVVEDSSYSVALGAEGLPLGCGFLSAEQTDYLATKFREVYEARTYLRDSQVPQEQRELLKRLESFNEELRACRKGPTALPLAILPAKK